MRFQNITLTLANANFNIAIINTLPVNNNMFWLSVHTAGFRLVSTIDTMKS